MNFLLEGREIWKMGDPGIFIDVFHVAGAVGLSSTARQVALYACLKTSMGFLPSIAVGVFAAGERKRLSDL